MRYIENVGLMMLIAAVCLRVFLTPAELIQGGWIWVYAPLLVGGVVGCMFLLVRHMRERRTEKMELAFAYKHGEWLPEMAPSWAQLRQMWRASKDLRRFEREEAINPGCHKGETIPLQPCGVVKKSIIRAAKKLKCDCSNPHVV
jgi:hypothetical protein